jgi:hypothetical protein
MASWKTDELARFARADEPQVSIQEEDDVRYTRPAPIWVVVVDDALYARSYLGQKGRWYQAALSRRVGRLSVGGALVEITFEPASGAVDDRVDDAYRAKYGASPYLAPMIAVEARATTLRIAPRI